MAKKVQKGDVADLLKSNKKRFWHLLEVEFIQGPDTPLARLVEKYSLSGSTVYKYSRRHEWPKKKTEYKKMMLANKKAEPDQREVFRDFVSRNIQQLAWRAEYILVRESEHIQRTNSGNLRVLVDDGGNVKKDEKGNPLLEEPFIDSASIVAARTAMLADLQSLGVAVFGPPPPVEPQDMIFEGIIKEQRISYIRVSEVGEEPPPITVEVPVGMTISDATGRPEE